jgi:hypothetical protein
MIHIYTLTSHAWNGPSPHINIAIAIPLNPRSKKQTHVSDRHSRLSLVPASSHRRGSSQSEQSAGWSKLWFVLLRLWAGAFWCDCQRETQSNTHATPFSPNNPFCRPHFSILHSAASFSCLSQTQSIFAHCRRINILCLPTPRPQ